MNAESSHSGVFSACSVCFSLSSLFSLPYSSLLHAPRSLKDAADTMPSILLFSSNFKSFACLMYFRNTLSHIPATPGTTRVFSSLFIFADAVEAISRREAPSVDVIYRLDASSPLFLHRHPTSHIAPTGPPSTSWTAPTHGTEYSLPPAHVLHRNRYLHQILQEGQYCRP